MRRLIRIFPAILWSGSAFVIGAGFAYGDKGIFPPVVFTGLINAVLLHGIAAHAFNDITDWASGTDALSPGVLSGGSKVIPLNIFTPEALRKAGIISIACATVLTFIFIGRENYGIWLYFAVGVWSAAAYTMPPLQLSYRPFLGELFAALPAVIALSLGTYYSAIGRLNFLVLSASVVQAMLALGWLMQHHLPDIQADLSATPVKLTTPAYIYKTCGRRWTNAVPVFYYILSLIISLHGITRSHVFFFPVATALICASVAAKTDIEDITDLTSREITTGTIIFVNSVLMSFYYIISSL